MNRWSKQYAECVECGTSDRPHHAHGLCKTCYSRMQARKPTTREVKKHYYRANKEHLRQYSKEYYQSHREERLAYAHEYRQKSPERIKASRKLYSEKYPEKLRAKCKAWHQNNREHVNQYNRNWKKRHPSIVRERVRIEQMNRRGAAGHARAEDVASRWELYGGLCYICGNEATATDHVIAVANGGTNWPANLRPICSRCNGRKGADKWEGKAWQWKRAKKIYSRKAAKL